MKKIFLTIFLTFLFSIDGFVSSKAVAIDLGIEIAVKGKKLKEFFLDNVLLLSFEEKILKEYRFQQKKYEVFEDGKLVESGKWKISGLLKNEIRLKAENKKKSYYFKKINKKPIIYHYNNLPSAQDVIKTFVAIESSSEFKEITENNEQEITENNEQIEQEEPKVTAKKKITIDENDSSSKKKDKKTSVFKKIKVFYAGFSFSNTYESNVTYAKYTSSLIKEKNPETGIDIVSSKLLERIKKSKFNKIDVDTENLLDFSKYPDNAIVMSVVLQHEEFTREFNYSSKTYNVFYDAYFQILFYDFSDKNLIASIPFDFEITILSKDKLDKKQILSRIKSFYLNDEPFKELDKKINKFDVKRKYDRRIGITNINIENRAFEEMPNNFKENQNSIKNLIAQTFSKRLSMHHNIAIVPYLEGQAIGKSMKMRFVQTDEIYSVKLANPDYHIHINLKGFKKVLHRTSDVEDFYLYGSFIDLKIFQPDLDKIYFNESLRGVTPIKIPKGQADLNDWRKYYYNLEILFNDFSNNIIKQDKKWMKKATKNKIKKDLKNLNTILEKVK